MIVKNMSKLDLTESTVVGVDEGVLWYRGEYISFRNYNCEIAGSMTGQ